VFWFRLYVNPWQHDLVSMKKKYHTVVVNTSWSFPHSWLISGFVTRLTRRVPLVEQELYTFRGHLSSHPVFSWVRVTRSLVLCVYFLDLCLSFCTFSFGHCTVCSSSIYGFWLPLWYLQTLLPKANHRIVERRKIDTPNTLCITAHIPDFDIWKKPVILALSTHFKYCKNAYSL